MASAATFDEATGMWRKGSMLYLRKPRGRPEDDMHTAIWAGLKPLLPDYIFAESFENRFVGAREGARRKARGVTAGTPDMQFVWEGRVYKIELKVPGNTPSKDQKDVYKRLNLAKCPWAVCHSFDEVVAQLLAWGLPLRGRVMA